MKCMVIVGNLNNKSKNTHKFFLQNFDEIIAVWTRYVTFFFNARKKIFKGTQARKKKKEFMDTLMDHFMVNCIHWESNRGFASQIQLNSET